MTTVIPLLLLLFTTYLSAKSVQMKLENPDYSFHHFTFLEKGDAHTTKFMVHILTQSNQNYISSIICKMVGSRIEDRRLVSLPSTTYSSGNILYFFQADFDTKTNSISNLYEFFAIVKKRNRENMHFWISPSRNLGLYEWNPIQVQMKHVLLFVRISFGSFFQIIITSKAADRFRVESFSIPRERFIPSGKGNKRFCKINSFHFS